MIADVERGRERRVRMRRRIVVGMVNKDEEVRDGASFRRR